jgi:septation ring formation regulator EzrA
VTPAPVDPAERVRWERQRSRITDVERRLGEAESSIKIVGGDVKNVVEQVREVKAAQSALAAHDTEIAKTLAAMGLQLAVQGTTLTTIERGVQKLEGARDSDGVKFRHVLQLVAAFLAIAVSAVVALTR